MTTETDQTKEAPMLNLYGQPDCGPCGAILRKFDRENVPHQYIDLSKDENAHHLKRLRATGVKMQTPIIETPTQLFSGFQPAKIDAAITEARSLAASQATAAMATPGRSFD